jgi:hypothetical protein
MATYFQIGSTVTVGAGGASSIEFTGIDQTYTDLVLKVSGRNGTGLDHMLIRFNSATTNYSEKILRGSGSAAASFVLTDIQPSGDALEIGYIGSDTSTFTNVEAYIPNYAGSTYKSMSIDAVQEANTTAAYMVLNAALWSNTSAITSITLLGQTYNFAQYTTASLYAIKKN